MPQHGFSLTPIIPHKERIEDSALARGNMGKRKPVFWSSLCSVD